jgi:hypothetical protein
MFFDALEDLDLVLQAYSKKTRDALWQEVQKTRGETFLAMVRDISFVKASLSEEQWKVLYSNASDSEVIAKWCEQARQAFREAGHFLSRGRRAAEEPQDNVCVARGFEWR